MTNFPDFNIFSQSETGDTAFENVYIYGKLYYDFKEDVITAKSINVNGTSVFGGDVTFTSDITLDESTSRNATVTGIATVGDLYVNGKLYDADGDFGTSGQLLSSDGTDLNWIDANTTSVANSINVGINLDSTNAEQFVTFVGANSGNNPIRVDNDFRYNPSTNILTIGGVAGNILPSGGIIIWSGAANAIPSGWALCNGQNSTPDLRGKFVVGYDNADSDFDVGDSGGSKDAVIVSHSHNHNLSGSTNNTGNHSHNVSGNSNNTGSHTHNRDKWGGNFGGSSGATVFRSDANGNRSTGSAGSHSHTISGNTNNTGAHSHNVTINGGSITSTGESTSNKNLPPYYALCYIMKT